MNVVYEINGYFGDSDVSNLRGNFILKENGWFNGVINVNGNDGVNEALIFGNFLPNKIIDFMIVKENVVMGATLIKTATGYEGLPIFGSYIIDEEKTNIDVGPSQADLIAFIERFELGCKDEKQINDKVSNLLTDEVYLMLHNSTFTYSDKRQELLGELYNECKGDVKALTRALSKY